MQDFLMGGLTLGPGRLDCFHDEATDQGTDDEVDEGWIQQRQADLQAVHAMGTSHLAADWYGGWYSLRLGGSGHGLC